MSDLRAVHFLDTVTWRMTRGWLNLDAVAVVRLGRLGMSGVLCEACAAKVGEVPLLNVDSSLVVVGDGLTDDATAVRAVRRARRIRARCEREQHRPFA